MHVPITIKSPWSLSSLQRLRPATGRPPHLCSTTCPQVLARLPPPTLLLTSTDLQSTVSPQGPHSSLPVCLGTYLSTFKILAAYSYWGQYLWETCLPVSWDLVKQEHAAPVLGQLVIPGEEAGTSWVGQEEPRCPGLGKNSERVLRLNCWALCGCSPLRNLSAAILRL